MYKLFKIKFLLSIIFLNSFVFAQNSEIDSLKKELSKNKHDTVKLDIMISIASEFNDLQKFNESIIYSNRVLKSIEKLLNSKLIAKKQLLKYKSLALKNLGLTYEFQGKYAKSIDIYKKTLEINRHIKDYKGESSTLMNLGIVYYFKGDFNVALNYYLKSLKIAEKINYFNNITLNHNNIGLIYWRKGNTEKALTHFIKSLNYELKLNNVEGIISSYDNIGIIYYEKNDYNKALYYFQKALILAEKNNLKEGISFATNNIGNIYFIKNDFKNAIFYLEKSLKIKYEIENYSTICGTLNNLGSVYIKLNNLYKAKKYFLNSLQIGKEIESKDDIKDSYNGLSRLDSLSGNWKSAYLNYYLFSIYKDSIFNEESNKQMEEMSARYDSEKKEQKIILLNKDKKLQRIELDKKTSENKKQQLFIFLITAIAFGLIIIAVIIFRYLQTTKKQKFIIEQQKNEVEIAHHNLEEKNREILESITYAKRIQSAILPQPKLVKEFLEDSFVLYKPKDIVAGDFYWLEVVGDTVLFAAADCTGHGVPGAMVSVVCNNGLNRAVREHKLIKPNQILDKTRELVVEEFEKSDEEVKDGMDISLCALDTTNYQLFWSGANNPLWILRNNEILEYKADKQPIGKHFDAKPFSLIDLKLEKNDIIYIFTDGYQDQFGGPKEKKFRAAQMKELFLTLADKTMEEQRKIIDQEFETWKGKLEQVDDVCVIGVRI